MKNIHLLIAIPLILAVFQSCRPTNKVEEMGDTTTGVDHTLATGKKMADTATIINEKQVASFMEQTAMDGMLVMALGKLASEKAGNPEIKLFGKLLEEDHRFINDSLTILATTKNMKLPTFLSEKDLEEIHKIEKMENDQFESSYMKMMEEIQGKLITLFRGASNSPDVSIGNFTRKFLPVLEDHYQKTLTLRKKLKQEADKSLLRSIP